MGQNWQKAVHWCTTKSLGNSQTSSLKPCAPAPNAVITVLDLQDFYPTQQVSPFFWEVNQSTGTDSLSPGNSTTPNTGRQACSPLIQLFFGFTSECF